MRSPLWSHWGAMLPAAFGAVLAGLGGVVWAAPDAVPWPRGQLPTPRELDDKVSDAVELFEQERADEILEAFELGEDSEHIFLLQERIDGGELSVEDLFTIGDSTFEHEFRPADGYGDGAGSALRRVHDGAYGGLDSYSCNGCHAVGGVNGAGSALATSFYFGDGAHVDSAFRRNPPAVLGLGYVQLAAAEMTRDLWRTRDRAEASARTAQAPVTVALESKGVSFGRITVAPNGLVDARELEGIDPDLVVKPFGWKGHTARLRRFGARAARIHFLIQSHVDTLEHQEDPDPGLYGFGPNWWDPDGDKRARELEEGTLTALAVYMTLLEVPVIIPPHDAGLRERWANGSELFDRIGCSDCHVRSLSLASTRWTEDPDTTGGPGVTINLNSDGEPPRADHGAVMLFSDLKRHDMGEELADPSPDGTGIRPEMFLTRPLWGLAESPPYLHDGRAPTIADAILAHGGEASPQRAGYEALSDEQRADIHIFLLSLTREPKLMIPR